MRKRDVCWWKEDVCCVGGRGICIRSGRPAAARINTRASVVCMRKPYPFAHDSPRTYFLYPQPCTLNPQHENPPRRARFCRRRACHRTRASSRCSTTRAKSPHPSSQPGSTSSSEPRAPICGPLCRAAALSPCAISSPATARPRRPPLQPIHPRLSLAPLPPPRPPTRSLGRKQG